MVLVNFWRPGAPPARTELPMLDQLAGSRRAGPRVVAISTDRDRSVVARSSSN